MARTAEEISRAIRAQLKLLDPEISAEPLTPERKLIDTVAEVIAEAEVDKYVAQYQFDIDTKIGEDLDRFVALFGFARQAGRRATGTVSFSRVAPATRDILIPVGTQVVKPATSVTPTLSFFTTASAILYTNTTSAEVPVEAAEIGPQGNVAAGTIISFGAGIATEISEVTNENASSGGDDEESDAELRVRFKNTIFRNVSGTSDMYLALAIASRFSRKANVIGPVSRFSEFLQVPAGSPPTMISQIPYSKYTHSFDYYLTNGSTSNETFYNAGSDYSFGATNTNPQTIPPTASAPTITVLNTTNLPISTVVLLEHSYTSINSRNDPANNILNKVDVYVSGNDITTATETLVFPKSTNNFSSTASSPYYRNRWKRADSVLRPAAGNRLQDLLWQPVTELPESITVGSSTYYKGTDYFLVNDDTSYRGSRRARSGIEWTSTAVGQITVTDTVWPLFTITYNFNRLAVSINELIDSHRQVTSDVLVHIANKRYFNVNVMMMYTPGFATSAVDTDVMATLSDFLEQKNFGAVIQLSDIMEVIHSVQGVDNVRLTTPNDGTAYGVQEVSTDGVTPVGQPYTSDFALQDSDLPVLNKINITRRSQNTWN